MPTARLRAPWLPLGGLAPSPLEWLCLVAGLALVTRYFWILDDAFVYFRYVDNLVHLGAGLTYNRGEYVEGFSSPLWCLLLIGSRAVGVDFWQASLAMALASFAAFWALAVGVQRSLTTGPAAQARADLALPYLTFNYGVASYFSSGLESPLVLVAAAAYALQVLRPQTPGLWAFLGLTPLVRHELILPLVGLVLWERYARGRVPWSLIGTSAATLGAWGLFRVFYYADLLPNTFYLKDVTWVGQGLAYLWNATAPYGLPGLVALALAGLVVLARARVPVRLPERLVLFAMAASVTVYVVRIGGDARHFRYLAFPFVLSVFAFAGVFESAIARWLRPLGTWGWSALGGAVAVASLALYPPQLTRHPLREAGERRMVRGISDALLHRERTWSSYHEWGARVSDEIRRRGHAAVRPYRDTVASYWCADHYRGYDVRVVHSYGLTDAILARVDVPSDRPAHKRALFPLAEDLLALQRAAGGARRGVYREAVNAGRAPAWIAQNLEAIETIEAKIHNDHDLLANLQLALAPRVRIDAPVARPRRRLDARPTPP